MFDKIMKFVKGVFGKMLTNEISKKAFNIESLMSKEMSENIFLWKKIYSEKAPWISEYIEASGTAAQIAGEFSRLTTLEMESEITGSKRADFLNEKYKEIKSNLNEKLELGNAVGGIYIKPYVSNGEIHVNFIEQGKFIPIAFDGDGNMTSVIFMDEFIEGKYFYTRLEWHYLENNSLIIINKAFKSDDNTTLGNEIPLEQIKKWSDIQPFTKIENIQKLLGGFYKVPKANHIDDASPLGVSIYSRGIKELKRLDKQISRLDWEYESAERKAYVDTTALNTTQVIGKDGKTVTKKPTVDKRLFQSLNVNEDNFFKDYSPEIRDEAYLRGINKYKQDVEFACDLAYGTISDPIYTDKTATEIKASKQKSYAVVSQMQRNLEKALNDLIYAMDVLCTLYKLAPAGKYDVSYKWDDSLIVDAEVERKQDIADINLGAMGVLEYRMKWYGETEEEAKKKIPQQADVIE